MESQLMINLSELSTSLPHSRKWEPQDLDARTIQAIEDWLLEQKPTFEFLVEMKSTLKTKGTLSPGQAKGVMNCIRAEAMRSATPGSNVRPNKFQKACNPRGAQVGVGSGRIENEGGKWQTYHLDGQCPEGAPQAVIQEDGIYMLVEGETTTIYKVQIAKQGSGNLYAKRLVPPDHDDDCVILTLGGSKCGHKAEWVYEGRAPLHLGLVKLDVEAAAKFGHLYGICGCCGADLTDEKSIARGIGPICYGKL
jgi:hypothetical protein